MSKIIEQEYKTLISQDQYKEIKAFLKDNYPTQTIIQHNAYYDRPDQALKEAKAAFRLRNFSNSSEWTLKQARTELESLEISQANPSPLEVKTEIPAQAIQETAILQFFQDHAIKLEDLRLTYQMLTKRLVVQLDQAEICLDLTQFGNFEDYELELEFSSDSGAKIWNNLLKQFRIRPQVPQKKIARAAAYHKA